MLYKLSRTKRDIVFSSYQSNGNQSRALDLHALYSFSVLLSLCVVKLIDVQKKQKTRQQRKLFFTSVCNKKIIILLKAQCKVWLSVSSVWEPFRSPASYRKKRSLISKYIYNISYMWCNCAYKVAYSSWYKRWWMA